MPERQANGRCTEVWLLKASGLDLLFVLLLVSFPFHQVSEDKSLRVQEKKRTNRLMLVCCLVGPKLCQRDSAEIIFVTSNTSSACVKLLSLG